MVAIIDYGMGNLASVQKSLNFLGIKSIITNDHEVIKKANIIILPGVGSFFQGMQNLRELGLIDVLTNQVVKKKIPFLGICLGMQLIMERGNEPKPCLGLGWIKGDVLKFKLTDLNVPHMGWNNIKIKKEPYFNDCKFKDFYFIHSYHVVPEKDQDIAATVNYGFEVVAAIQSHNIFATQFHPEKSQEDGLSILKTFFEINA